MLNMPLESWVMLAMIAGMGFALGFINHRCRFYKKDYKRLEGQYVNVLRQWMQSQSIARRYQTKAIVDGLEEIMRQADKEVIETMKEVTSKPDGETEADHEAHARTKNH